MLKSSGSHFHACCTGSWRWPTWSLHCEQEAEVQRCAGTCSWSHSWCMALWKPGSSLGFSSVLPCRGSLVPLTLPTVLVDVATSAWERVVPFVSWLTMYESVFPQTITTTKFYSSLLLISNIFCFLLLPQVPSHTVEIFVKTLKAGS